MDIMGVGRSNLKKKRYGNHRKSTGNKWQSMGIP